MYKSFVLLFVYKYITKINYNCSINMSDNINKEIAIDMDEQRIVIKENIEYSSVERRNMSDLNEHNDG